MLAALLGMTPSVIHQPAPGDSCHNLAPFLVEPGIVRIGIHLEGSASEVILRDQAGASGEHLRPHDGGCCAQVYKIDVAMHLGCQLLGEFESAEIGDRLAGEHGEIEVAV